MDVLRSGQYCTATQLQDIILAFNPDVHCSCYIRTGSEMYATSVATDAEQGVRRQTGTGIKAYQVICPCKV